MPRELERRLRRVQGRAVVEHLRASLWFVPSLVVIGSVVAAALLSRVEVDRSSLLDGITFPGGADSARGILQAIAGSVITVTGVVFSLTVVTLQLASTQFSPRLLRTFLRDVSNQIVLGTFLGTFSYALVVLRAVQSGISREEDVVPQVAVTGAYVLAGASVVALVYFIDHIARSIRIDSLMREVNEDTRSVIAHVHPPVHDGPRMPLPVAPEAPEHAVEIPAMRSGFVQAIDDGELLRAAVAHDVRIRVLVPIGDRIIEGATLARVWRGAEACDVDIRLREWVEDAIQIGYERTMQQDVAFGFRQLADVATKALSPGINDPTTAIHALAHLAGLLTLLAGRCLEPFLGSHDDAGEVRVVVPVATLPAYLDLACGQIRRYGAAEPAVTFELLRLLRDVARCGLSDADLAAVERQADMVMSAAQRATPEPRDLEALHSVHQEVLELVGAATTRSSGGRRSAGGETPA